MDAVGREGSLQGTARGGGLWLELLHPDAGLVEAEQVAYELAEVDAPGVSLDVERTERRHARKVARVSVERVER